MKRILKMLVAVLCLSALLLSATSCSASPLSSYKEDTEDGKSTYYVAMAIEGYGVIIVQLDSEAAPKTVENFVKLVREDFYDGLTFHRVMENFMIQGGDPKGDGTGDGPLKIVGEFKSNGYENDIKHLRGTLSMARGNDNNSASCQFFICNATSPHLDGSYAAFGYVLDGMDVVDEITEAKWHLGAGNNGTITKKSLQPVIESIVLLDNYEW